ncbi:MAG: NTP transferase domain-containing protein [Candidatus Omnitrophota bacterium]
MKNLCVVILAAGEGKRMKSALPKVLHEVYGKAMLSRVIDAARGIKGVKKIITVVGRHKADIRAVVDKDVTLVQQHQPLGTADAVKAAQRAIPAHVGDVIVLYGDTPLITTDTIKALYACHAQEDAACTVLTTSLANPTGYGRIVRGQGGDFIGIVEDKDADFAQKNIKEINTGMYCFKRQDLLDGLKCIKPSDKSGEFYLTDVFSYFFSKGKRIVAFGVQESSEVLGVNSKYELLEAQRLFRRRILRDLLDKNVQIMDLDTIFIDETAKIGPGTKIYPFTYIEKNVCIGRDCSVGPYCHLRENAVLKNSVSVGNFAEIKNSTLDDGTFMRHMSYLGDTRVGKKVNIGAGSVVANFDGKKKHKTVIDDGAFIGCDAVLIAPVVVGKNAVVGAGSIVTKKHNVGPGSVVVGAPAREIKLKK